MPSNDRTQLWTWLAPALTAALLGSLTLPTTGFFADDWMHLVAVRGQAGPERRWDLFRFFDGDPTAMQSAMDAGAAPWFAHPELKVAMWRPLTTTLAHVDHALFGASALGPSLHSLLWYIALCAVVGLLLRKLLPGRLALVSALLFAASATHVQAAAWIAGRGVLVCATLGLLGWLAHIHWRQDGWRLGAIAGPALLCFGMLAGEAGVGVVIYLLAWELFRAGPPLRDRLMGMVPTLVVTAGWLAAYVYQGYGTAMSGAYISPLTEPLTYLAHLPQRLAFAAGVLFAGLPADVWLLRAADRTSLALLGGFLAVAVLSWAASMLRHQEPETRRPVLVLLAGAALCLLPQVAGLLGARSFVVPSLGGSVVLAALVLDVLPADGGLLWLRRVGAALLLIAHVGVGLVLWLTSGAGQQSLSQVAGERLTLVEDADKHAIIITTPDPWFGVYGPVQLMAQGRTLPASWHVLSLAECDHTWSRTGPRSFDLATVDCDLLQGAFAEFYRAHGTMQLGDEVAFAGHRAEVLEVVGGDASRVRFTFDRPLEQLHLIAWHDGELVVVEPPQPGVSIPLRWRR